MSKLYEYGIHGQALNGIDTYLRVQTQFFEIPYNSENGVRSNDASSSLKTNIAIPHGSVLEAVLFLLYINNLPSCVEHGKLLIFADYTTISFENKNPEGVEIKAYTELTFISHWLK